jgi:hypothetical protein
MGMMTDLPAAPLIAVSKTVADLMPFLVVLVAGFLVGAWGQSARLPIAVIAGMILIMLAIGGFLIENGSGPTPDVTP